jgi:hypothetical protein
MPNLGPLKGKPPDESSKPTGHLCRLCHQELRLVRRHTSPARLGAPVTTEFYQCGACDSGFALNPATGKWKGWSPDES